MFRARRPLSWRQVTRRDGLLCKWYWDESATFNYTVLSTHVAADLDYKATTSLALPTGTDTIRDNLATNATLTLASPGAAIPSRTIRRL